MKDLKNLVEQQLAAFDDHDAKRFASGYATDAVVIDPVYPEPLRGQDAIENDIQDFFTAFPDIECDYSTLLAGEDTVAFEAQVWGTHDGPLVMGGSQPIPPSGRKFTMDIAVFIHVDSDGLITSEERYFDTARLMAQLAPEAETGWGEQPTPPPTH